MNYAPIALFTYNRPDHTQQAVESLLTNAEAKYSDLYIFSDGPKNDKAVEGVKANREYIRSLKAANNDINSPSLNREGRGGSFLSVTIVEREKNWGLANSLIAGITEVINKYGRVIVVEDDLVLSPYFLQFMNEALEKYKDDDRVGTITAYVPPIKEQLPETFFLMYFMCWGWATWKRAWDLLEKDPRPLLKGLRFKKTKFDVGGGVGNYGNLYCQKVGLVDSWYVRYYASLFLKGKLSFYPGHSLATNDGLDGTGVHCGKGMQTTYSTICYDRPIVLENIAIEENSTAYQAFCLYFMRGERKPTIRSRYQRLKGFIRRLLFIDSL